MNFQISPKSTETELNWYDAMEYCQSLNINGITDWRLPTSEELQQIFESDNDFNSELYWTSLADVADFTWKKYFSCGNSKNYDKDDVYYVRAVKNN